MALLGPRQAQCCTLHLCTCRTVRTPKSLSFKFSFDRDVQREFSVCRRQAPSQQLHRCITFFHHRNRNPKTVSRLKHNLSGVFCFCLFFIKFSSLSAPTKIEELTAGSDEKTSIFVGAEREENLIGMIPTRASLRLFIFYFFTKIFPPGLWNRRTKNPILQQWVVLRWITWLIIGLCQGSFFFLPLDWKQSMLRKTEFLPLSLSLSLSLSFFLLDLVKRAIIIAIQSLLPESGPVGPSRAPANINERVCVCVCVCVSVCLSVCLSVWLSTGFVPVMIMIKRWSHGVVAIGKLTDWTLQSLGVTIRWQIWPRSHGTVLSWHGVTCWYPGQTFSFQWWLAVRKPGMAR